LDASTRASIASAVTDLHQISVALGQCHGCGLRHQQRLAARSRLLDAGGLIRMQTRSAALQARRVSWSPPLGSDRQTSRGQEEDAILAADRLAEEL
jgi:hypothetical protein